MIEASIIDIQYLSSIVVDNLKKIIQWSNANLIIKFNDDFSVSFWVVLLAFFVVEVVTEILLAGKEVRTK